MKKKKLIKLQALKDMRQSGCDCSVFEFKKQILNQPKLTIRSSYL